MAITKRTRDSKCWQVCGKKGTLVPCWWECKMVQPLWTTVWSFLKKLKIEVSDHPAIPLLKTDPKDVISALLSYPHCSSIHNSRGMETTYVFVGRWKDKENIIYSYKRHIKEAFLKIYLRASLMVRWLRIHLPMQGTWVLALVREDPTCRRATKPMCHSYWACALESVSHNYWAHMLQLLKPVHLEPVLRNKGSHRNEKPAHHNEE